MKAILDGKFIINCMRKRIDFVSDLTSQGFGIVVPREVLQELKDLCKNSGLTRQDRAMVREALHLHENKLVEEISLGNNNIKDWLLKKGQEGYYIATTSSNIKRRVRNYIDITSERGEIFLRPS